MTQLIEIDGGLVRVVDRNVQQEVPLEDWLGNIERRPPVTMFKPRSAIFTHWDESNPADKKVLFVCELDPGIRSIVKLTRRYRIAIPWTYFIFSFLNRQASNEGRNWQMVDYYVYHAPSRVRDLDDRLWTAFLPNVYENGNICFGSTGVDTMQPLPDRVDEIVNNWYLTQFNNDVHGSRAHPLPFNGRLPNGWAFWVRNTAEHGLNAYTMFPEWNMRAGENGVTSYTLRQLLDTVSRTMRPNRLDNALPTMADVIPAIPTVMTFGRTEEWLRSLNGEQRFRLQVALTNMVADDPTTVQEPPATEIDPNEPMEDGGEPV